MEHPEERGEAHDLEKDQRGIEVPREKDSLNGAQRQEKKQLIPDGVTVLRHGLIGHKAGDQPEKRGQNGEQHLKSGGGEGQSNATETAKRQRCPHPEKEQQAERQLPGEGKERHPTAETAVFAAEYADSCAANERQQDQSEK